MEHICVYYFSSFLVLRFFFNVLSDCAVCAEGYGRSLSNTCHSCSGALAWLLVVACTGFFVLALVLLLLTAVFFVGGRDGIKATRQSVVRKLSTLRKASRMWQIL